MGIGKTEFVSWAEILEETFSDSSKLEIYQVANGVPGGCRRKRETPVWVLVHLVRVWKSM